MLRLNRWLVARHLSKPMANCHTSQFWYSTEPPDHHTWVKASDATSRQIQVDITDAFFRKTGPELKLFGPQDLRAPLNGNIGLACEQSKRLEIETLLKLIRESGGQLTYTNSQQTSDPSNNLKHIQSLLSEGPQTRRLKFFQILKHQRFVPNKMVNVTKSSDSVDCSANDLPLNTIDKFASLFPKSKRLELNNGLTVMTMTKKTQNDMTSYSEQVELERDHFFEQFISDAKSMCQQLNSNGYWADFIDPYSGQPFLVSDRLPTIHTNLLLLVIRRANTQTTPSSRPMSDSCIWVSK